MASSKFAHKTPAPSDDDDYCDLSASWVCFRDLPDDVLAEMPEHVQIAFHAARKHNFAIELISPGAQAPSVARAPRRMVLLSDNMTDEPLGGPLGFDLQALTVDIRNSKRIFVVSVEEDDGPYTTAYSGAAKDLSEGHDVSLIIETTPVYQRAWLDSLIAIRGNQRSVHAAGRC